MTAGGLVAQRASEAVAVRRSIRTYRSARSPDFSTHFDVCFDERNRSFALEAHDLWHQQKQAGGVRSPFLQVSSRSSCSRRSGVTSCHAGRCSACQIASRSVPSGSGASSASASDD
jgi:hypothetical protein